ncbi:uncharacterized protein L199_003026 [Kwoniella botswanensis]|uniref:uncharacterized protein n=1 Tax=Kwoniella botswanensis TaxID=1268659 RepID=UPI00315D43AF
MGLFDKLKDQFQSSSPSYDFHTSTHPLPLGPDAVFRYRYQRGVNLGSWFTLERWIASHPFRNAHQPGQSDFDVASGRDAKKVLEEHWDTWMNEGDWRWIKEKGFNSVRIPISYYHLCGPLPEVLKGTEFEPFHHIFEGAWGRIKQAIEMAGYLGLGVLIDLHAAAGAQNADAHSGLSNGKVGFWDKHSNLASTSLALRFLASELSRIPHVVGLEVLNEPANNSKLQGWYRTILDEIRSIVPVDFPLYISDAWDTQHYANFVGGRDDFVVLDHHLYRCFTDQDRQKDGYAHAHDIRSGFKNTLSGQSESAKGNIIIGEWSASLDPHSFPPNIPDTEKDAHRREFVKAQLELFEEKTAGYWFWTYKKQDGWDAGWSAKDAARAEILPQWIGGKRFKGDPPVGVKDSEMKSAYDAHTSYWASHGGSPDPTVFAPGFSQGWDDSLTFLSHPSGPSRLGFTDQWMKSRKIEFENYTNKKLGKATWEWEHGFRQGVEASLRICTY